MKITITIDTDNAAFEEGLGWELHRVLEDAERKAMQLLTTSDPKERSEELFDVNGNTVGDVRIARRSRRA